MSHTTTVVLITGIGEESRIAAVNSAWSDHREQFREAMSGGYKAGDVVWTCVFNHLDCERLLDTIRWQRWGGTIWVLIRRQDAEQYEILTLAPPEPGGTQPSPFTTEPLPAKAPATEACMCGVVCSARHDPQYGTVWHCPGCGRDYVDER